MRESWRRILVRWFLLRAGCVAVFSMLAVLGELLLELDRRLPQSHVCESQSQFLAKSCGCSQAITCNSELH